METFYVTAEKKFYNKWNSFRDEANQTYEELFQLIQNAERLGEGDDELLNWLIKEQTASIEEQMNSISPPGHTAFAGITSAAVPNRFVALYGTRASIDLDTIVVLVGYYDCPGGLL
jgi:hypothetical protein